MEENQVGTEPVISDEVVTAQEKMLPQSEVNKIVGHAKEEAAAKARKSIEDDYAVRLQELNAMRNSQEESKILADQNMRNQSVSRDVDVDSIYQKLQEKYNQDMQQREMESVAQNYSSKLDKGRQTYEDFDAVTQDFDPVAFPQLLYLVSGMENGEDVIYELSKNPSKLATLDYLAQRSPKQAQSELAKLSRSITDNREAQSSAQSNPVDAPLNRLQPSRISGSNGKMSISDLRRQSYLKG